MKGLDSIVNITSKLVPLMGLGYILLSIIVIILNIQKLPVTIMKIIKSSLN